MCRRGDGLTRIFSAFHNPQDGSAEIVDLRNAHAALNFAVAHAYNWQDLSLSLDFRNTKQGLRYTTSAEANSQVLNRLLTLNNLRHADESTSSGKATVRQGKKLFVSESQTVLGL